LIDSPGTAAADFAPGAGVRSLAPNMAFKIFLLEFFHTASVLLWCEAKEQNRKPCQASPCGFCM